MSKVQLTDELKRRILYGEGVGKDAVSLRIGIEKINARLGKPHEAEVVVQLVDGKGIPLATLQRLTMAEGGQLTLADLSRAFEINIS